MLSFKNFLTRLEEDYKTSEKRFLDQGANPGELKAVIDFHKANKNTFKPEWKNIDAIKDWKIFRKFIKDRQEKQKVKQSFKKEQDQVTLRDDDKWLILVPLDHKTSCFHGSDTDWCTTKADEGYFTKYFFEDGVILVYCIKKNKTKDKWAVALQLDHLNKSNFFDKRDSRLTKQEFESQTGLNFEDIVNGVKANQDYIKKKRKENEKKDLHFLLKQAKKTRKPNKDLENLIIATKNAYAAYIYASDVLKGPWKEAEPVIAKDPGWAYHYAFNILGEPFKLGEPAIAKDPYRAYEYALNVLREINPKKWAKRYLAGEIREKYSSTILSFKEFLAECWLPPEVSQRQVGKKSILTDINGMTLYIFDDDKEDSVSTCYGDCAVKWPPLRAMALSNDKEDSAWVEYSHDNWTLVTRQDGTQQWAYKGKPLYYWYKDKKPGDASGEKIKGWHIAYWSE
jgi:predicted lipoprotein with Yx(FWY)xxD motif